MLRILFLFVFALSAISARADHAMGGQITWKCQGNSYVFELIFYRDCNGAEINTISENLEVKNHPSISAIPVLFISRQDISPSCSPVAGSANPLTCGIGTGGGNGTGAVEKITYRSNPIVLTGVPPAGTGWIFTYVNFSRNGNISNLQNPITYGLTIAATMFAVPNAVANTCLDNSVNFLQDPYFISCVGDPYEYNLHPVDIDLDSIHCSFGIPYDNYSGTYSPGTNPIAVPFEPGYSVNSPTPDASFAAGNIPSTLDPNTGNLTFTSNTVGSYVIKVQATSYRQGVKVSIVEREMQIYVNNCAGVNTSPDVVGPFAGAFTTTVTAGNPVAFTFQSTDVELLQDGSPQSNYLSVTSPQFGTAFTSTSGCLNGPCATLNQTPVINGVQGVSANFNWQTDCAHLIDAAGTAHASVPYTFVFKIQDNYCQIPKVTYKTITINVVSPTIIPATSINCISTAANGDVAVSWDPVLDPDGTFVAYHLYSVQTGLIGTFPIGTTTTTVPSPGAALSFYVGVASGCNGTAEEFSDTLKNVFLTISNPANGTAVLDWNTPITPTLPMFGTTCDVQREYPTGTWTTIATVPYLTVHFLDTIDICQAFLNYRIIYNTPACVYNSNVVGDIFEDMQTPSIPVVSAVSIDTLTGNAVITWNVNNQSDTKGYVIYWKDPNGFIVEIDTVYGINNTTYTYPGAVNGPLTFSVAAFDSCMTTGTNPTYQTSAKAELNTSMYTSESLNKCNSIATISWSAYLGWGANLVDYSVLAQKDGGAWVNLGNTATTSFDASLVQLSTYCIAIRANKSDGTESFSNKICFLVDAPTPPATHYLRVASVEQDKVTLRHQISMGTNVTAIRLEKYNPLNSNFETLATLPVTSSTLTYIDSTADVHYTSYTYRAVVIDSCGLDGLISNVARTIFLKVTTDQNLQSNYLNWSSYIDYDGGVLEYQIFRGIDGNFDSYPFVIVPPTERYVQDDVSQLPSHTGRFCYYVNAYEAADQYGIQETALSNVECIAITPLVYVPNAFTPDGYNPIFKPVVSFSDVTKYEFSVVDRWGQVLFQTTDLNLGWDGKHPNGKTVTNDVFMYVVKVVDGNNQEHYYRGTVTVVK